MDISNQPFTARADRPPVNAQKLWAGGVASALVVALVALVGVLVFRGVFEIPILAPEGNGVWGDASTVQLMIAGGVCALLATGLVHLLLLSTPRALMFFAWTIGLATVAATLLPFATDAELDSKAATAALNLVIGIAILSLVSGVTRSAMPPPNRGRPQAQYGP